MSTDVWCAISVALGMLSGVVVGRWLTDCLREFREWRRRG